MGLLQKKPQLTSSAPLYTLGSSKTILVIGLGNPGRKYEGTRHNTGFSVVDYFAKQNEFAGWLGKKDLKADISINNLGDNRVILCRPATFMNLSGEAARAVQRFYRIYNQDTLVVYDELALPFGQLRTRVGGSDAGHNGLKSLIQHLGEDFGRLRIGVGPLPNDKADSTDFVLSKFSKKEQVSLPIIWKEANALITEFIFSGSLPHETRTIT